MNWIKNLLEPLLEPLLDRLALKLSIQVRAQMDCAINAALDRADDRIDTDIKGLEERLQAAATKPIADLKVTLGPVLQLKQQLEALEAAVKPALTLQQQIEAISPERLQAAAEVAGMISVTEMKAKLAFAASLAKAAALDQLRSCLTRPRPWTEIPDR
jgi:hypothetical protein